MAPGPTDIPLELATLPNPVPFLEALFALAPVGFQVFTADGHCIATNKAFRDLFGSAPPPGYNILKDEIAHAGGLLASIHRAFAGETIALPPLWYDPRELKQMKVTEGRRVAVSATLFPLISEARVVTHVALIFKDLTAEWEERERLERALQENQRIGEELRSTEERIRLTLEAANVGTWEWNIVQDTVSWSPNIERIFGLSAGSFAGTYEAWLALIHPDDRAWLSERIAQSVRSHAPYEAEMRVVRQDGTTGWQSARGYVALNENGKAKALRGIVFDVTQRRQAQEDVKARVEFERAAAMRTQRLLSATAAFGRALTTDQVIRVIHTEVLPSLGADSGSVTVVSVSGTVLELSWAHGYTRESLEPFKRFALAAALPHSDAARSQTPVYLETAGAIVGSYPVFEGSNQLGALASLPLLVGGRCIGVLAASYREARQFPPNDRNFAEALAGQCAQALERARIFRDEQAGKQRLKLLADASSLLSQSLEYQRTMETLTRLMVPSLAEWCAVDMLEGDQIRRLAVANVDPVKEQLAIDYHRKYPLQLNSPTGIGAVIRTGKSEWVEDIPSAVYEAMGDLERRRDSEALGIKSYLSVPLTSRSKILGALTLVYAESGRHYTAVDQALAEDIAHRAAASLDNALLYQEAQEAIFARDSFLSVASHELNTPLTSIKLNFQSLQRALSQLPAEAKETLRIEPKFEVVNRQLVRLTNLIRELLDVSRITSGHLKLELEEVNLVSVVNDAIARVSEDAVKANCAVRVDVTGELLGIWDRLRLDQVVTNLLSNAIKYGHDQPVAVSVKRDGEFAELRVKDLGIGIAPSDQERLFQRFERMVSEQNYSGWGLGLWIVKQVLDAMGGTIEVASAPGEGSTFTVRLPIGQSLIGRGGPT